MRFPCPVPFCCLIAALLGQPLASGQELRFERSTGLTPAEIELSWQTRPITPEGRTPIYPQYELQKSSDLSRWELLLTTVDSPLTVSVEEYSLTIDPEPGASDQEVQAEWT